MFKLTSIQANWETKIFHLFSLPTLRKGCLEGFRADRVAACVSTQAICAFLNYKYNYQHKYKFKGIRNC